MKNRIDIENGRYWDRALSLVDGCTPCSPGCDHCWSAAMTKGGRLTVSDDELIQAVADLWVENGGDSEGFTWLQHRIRKEIERIEEVDHE
jgi:protein gp37